MFYFLSWGKGDGTMVGKQELKQSIFDMDLETLVPESTCNIRKENKGIRTTHTKKYMCASNPNF